MRNYYFKARNCKGEMLGGKIKASCCEAVGDRLKSRGYWPISIRMGDFFGEAIDSLNSFNKRVSLNDLANFSAQLSRLLKAGLTLPNALETIGKQCANKTLAGVIDEISGDLENSASLSEAMAKHPKIFRSDYTSIIHAAQQSGSLCGAFKMLAAELAKQAKVKGQIVTAMTYPAFLLVVCFAVVGVLMNFVVPRFISLFVNNSRELPLPTKILVRFTGMFSESWWVILLAVVGMVFCYFWMRKNVSCRYWLDRFALRMPMVGKTNVQILTARFSRTMGSLLKGGVNVIEAMEIAGATIGNIAFRRQVAQIKSQVIKGSTVSVAMEKSGVFTAISVNMIAVGEQSGDLADMFYEVSSFSQHQSEKLINRLVTLSGPLMIVVLGLMIGFVVMAILLPVFETTTIIGS